eukprot:TRINITY_DN2510_c0_g1_i1.p1 TRINITY_DN2510_c0_g1~~TRINITY_DN2510_c0_g1_i1.p1  ORF type:complete len:249 (+),score=21.51 TRINITY_DN2510_c0_g1_i1:131-877(+)
MLYRAIIHNQYPDNCRAAKRLYFPDWPFGIGSLTHVKSFTFAAALNTARTFVTVGEEFSPNFQYVKDDPLCIASGRHGSNCYFLPISKCNERDLGIDRGIFTRVKDQTMKKLKSDDAEFYANSWENLSWDPINVIQEIQVESLDWYAAQLVAYLFRLQPDTKEYCLAKKETIKLGDHYAGLHIRRGDKFIESDPIPLATYIKLLNENIPEGVKQVRHVIFFDFFINCPLLTVGLNIYGSMMFEILRLI